MGNDELGKIERRLKKILDSYARAQSMGDFKDIVFSVHTALEDAANHCLHPSDMDLSFNEKFQRLMPELFNEHRLEQINQQRNHFAHPIREFSELEVRQTAEGIVEFALAAWPRLFNTNPPQISRPTKRSALPNKAGQFPSSPAPQRKAYTPIKIKTNRLLQGLKNWWRLPWLTLVMGLVFGYIVILLGGATRFIYEQRESLAWYWLAAAAVLLAAACYFALRNLFYFFMGLGLRRLAGLVIVAALVVVVITAFGNARALQPASPAEVTETVIEQARAKLEGVYEFALATGEEIAREYLPLKTEVPGVIEIENESDLPAAITANPLPTRQAAAATQMPLVATSTPAKSDKISVGTIVSVQTDGTRLRGRENPGLNTAVVAYFDDGAKLEVLDGPVAADGYVWWKVEGKGGIGWSVQDFLVVAER